MDSVQEAVATFPQETLVPFASEPVRALKLDGMFFLKVNGYHSTKIRTPLVNRLCSVQLQEYGALISDNKVVYDAVSNRPKITVLKAGLRLSMEEISEVRKRLQKLMNAFEIHAENHEEGEEVDLVQMLGDIFDVTEAKYGFQTTCPVLEIKNTNGLYCKVRQNL